MAADTLRIATYNPELARQGPGLLVQDIAKGQAQIDAVVAVIVALNADVLWLNGVDWDHDLVALGLLADRLAAAGAVYPHRFALRPNTGMPTGLDLDGDGLLGGPRDAQGYGNFAGQAGMAVLSRLPIAADAARDFSGLLWRDLPGAIPPKDAPGMDVQRLSTTGHWDVPVDLPGGRLHLLGWYATPPVFDGPEDRNGRRNHDEAMLWQHLLAGDMMWPPPEAPFVILGQANLDPVDGDGLRAGIAGLLAHPGVQDVTPRGTQGADTADYGEGIGGLRVDYVLPSAGLRVAGSGVMWPPPGDPMAATLAAASRHYPVWVDLVWPSGDLSAVPKTVTAP